MVRAPTLPGILNLSLIPSRTTATPLHQQGYTSREQSCSLREALAWFDPDSDVDNDEEESNSMEPRGTGQLVPLQPFSILEALSDLEPVREYCLHEALSKLRPGRENCSDEYGSDECGSDEDVDLDIASNGILKHSCVRTGDFIVKEVVDWLNADIAPRRVSLRDQSVAHASIASRLLLACKSECFLDDSDIRRCVFPGTREEIRTIIIHLTVLQLLASTFTISPATSLPAALYLSSCERQRPEMISSLRLHSLVHTNSPAAGHHARNNSVQPIWSDLFGKSSREELRADEVTQQRLQRLRKAERAKSVPEVHQQLDLHVPEAKRLGCEPYISRIIPVNLSLKTSEMTGSHVPPTPQTIEIGPSTYLRTCGSSPRQKTNTLTALSPRGKLSISTTTGSTSHMSKLARATQHGAERNRPWTFRDRRGRMQRRNSAGIEEHKI